MAPHRASPSTSRALRASVSSACGFFTAVLACDPFTAHVLLALARSFHMSQSLQAYVTDPTSCAIDRATNIVAPVPPPRAQKHHEKAVARCAKSTVEFTRSGPPPASATARRRGARSSASSTSSARAGCSTNTCAPPRALRSELCFLSVSLCCSMLHTHRTGMGVRRLPLSLARLARLSESRRLSTGNRPGRATPSCPSPPCPRTPTCRTRCPRRRRRRTG